MLPRGRSARLLVRQPQRRRQDRGGRHPAPPRPGLIGWALVLLRGTAVITILLTGVILILPLRAAEWLGDEALQSVELSNDPHYVATHPDIDVLVEVAGGTGPARDWVLAAMELIVIPLDLSVLAI